MLQRILHSMALTLARDYRRISGVRADGGAVDRASAGSEGVAAICRSGRTTGYRRRVGHEIPARPRGVFPPRSLVANAAAQGDRERDRLGDVRARRLRASRRRPSRPHALCTADVPHAAATERHAAARCDHSRSAAGRPAAIRQALPSRARRDRRDSKGRVPRQDHHPQRHARRRAGGRPRHRNFRSRNELEAAVHSEPGPLPAGAERGWSAEMEIRLLEEETAKSRAGLKISSVDSLEIFHDVRLRLHLNSGSLLPGDKPQRRASRPPIRRSAMRRNRRWK